MPSTRRKGGLAVSGSTSLEERGIKNLSREQAAEKLGTTFFCTNCESGIVYTAYCEEDAIFFSRGHLLEDCICFIGSIEDHLTHTLIGCIH